MIYLYAFLIGGLICALAQLIMDLFKLTVGHMTVLFVVLGGILSINGFYNKIVEVSGAGGFLPITSFGNSLAEASYEKAIEIGWIGLFTGIFDKTGGGILLTFILSIIIALIAKPRS